MPIRWAPAAALLLLAGTAAAAVDTTADSPKEVAMAIARKARRAEKAGKSAQAYIFYSEAAALQPRNRRYRSKMELLRTDATRQSKPVPRVTAEPSSGELPPLPGEVFDSLTARDLADARELQEPKRLQARPGRRDFAINDEPRKLFDQVAQAFGLETVYDGDYPFTEAPIRFHLSGADYREALNGLEAATGSFVIPLTPRLFMIAKDTPAKRNELEPTMALSIPVPQILTTQELTEMTQVVRQITNIEKIGWDTPQQRIVIRDRVSRVLPAKALLEQLFSYRPEVMIDLEFIQVASSDILKYGFTVTDTFSGIYLGQILHNVVSVPSGITNLLTFGGGRTLFGIGVAQAQAMFNQTTTSGNMLLEAQLRSVAGQPASLHVGEKYPVITGGYFGAVPPGQQGQVYAPPPSFTFEDLGLEMKITPFIHGMDEVTLKIESAFQVLTGQTINDIPVIGSRNMTSEVRLRNQEWAVLGGLISDSSSKSVAGFWGLAQMPLLGNLFKQTTRDREKNNLLIGIRPRLLSLPPDQMVTRALRVGSDARPFTPL
jgi:general secretion pathway protein D